MRVLFVSSGSYNSISGISPFVQEQGESLKRYGINVDFFLIRGHGVFGYLSNLPRLRNQIRNRKYDLIHAHYGLSGLLCVLQRKIPVVITFHGGDILKKQNNIIMILLSWFAALVSSWNIFVNQNIPILFKIRISDIIPCGVDLNFFKANDLKESRRKMNLNGNQIYLLFSGAFDNKVKNYCLAKKSIALCGKDYKLLELNGYKRNEVALLLNASNLMLLTSVSEGSPQVIKEALACNCPIVSTDVGDIRECISGVEGCYITSFEPEDVAKKIEMAVQFGRRTHGRERILSLGLRLDDVAKRIVKIYCKVLSQGG